MSSLYSLIMPKRYNLDTVDNSIKVIKDIDSYKTYESVITRCIGYSNDIILTEVLNYDNFDFDRFKMELTITYRTKMFLIEYALRQVNLDVIKIMFKLFKLNYEPEYDELIVNGKLIYKDNCLINRLKDFDYIIENFEVLTGKPLLIYEECVNVLENYMGEKLNDDNKDILRNVVMETQENMYNMRQEMSEMNNHMYEEWYNWKTDANYHSYDSYPINEQIEIWEYFKNYYESVECESECDEEDYDY